MENDNKEKWINDTIESIDGLKKAEPNPFLFAKVLNRIKTQGEIKTYIPAKRALIGLASIFILILLNVFVIFNTSGSTQKDNIEKSSQNNFIPSQSNPYLEILMK